jgi:hypothetical protein
VIAINEDAPIVRMNHCDDILRFILAGNAYFTLRSAKTGTRYTFRVSKKKDGDVHFVSTMYGSDNTADYAYLGVIKNGQFTLTAKSRFTNDSPQAKAFGWAFDHIMGADRIPDVLEFWHEGRCGRCARLLTVPESIANGIGPECAKRFTAEAA